MKFIKCPTCDVKETDDKCVLATYKRVINGEEHIFCCEQHANEYEQTLREQQ